MSKKRKLHLEEIAALESYFTDKYIFQFGFYNSGVAFIARDGYLINYDEVPFDDFPVFPRAELRDFVHDMFVYQCTQFHSFIKISPKYE